MDVYTLDPLTDPRWTEFEQRHPKATIFHTAGWLRALRKTYGYLPIALTTSPPGTNLTNGIPFCCVDNWPEGRRLVSLPFSDHCTPLVESSEELACFAEALQKRFAKERYRYIELRFLNLALNIPFGLESSDYFFWHGIDLRRSLEEVFASFHKDCVQRKIRRAERESLTYKRGTSHSLLSIFYRLLLTTRRRQGLPPQPIDWFRNLLAFLGDAVTIRVAFKGSRPVAGTFMLRHRRVVVYKYACSDSAFNHYGGPQLLLWKAIQETSGDNIEEVDMGRSDPHNPGLVKFKDRWGTTRCTLSYWRCPGGTQRGHHVPRAMRAAQRIFTLLPDKLLIAAGKLLYKRAG